MKGQFKKGNGENVWYLIIYGDADVLRNILQIFVEVLEIKLKKIQVVLYTMIKIT